MFWRKIMAKKLEEIKEEECPYELPEGWKWKYIADVSTVVTGSTPSKKEIDYYSDKGGFPFFKPADLDSGRKLYNSSEYLSDKGKNISKIIPSGSTLVCCIGTIGKSAYMEVEGTTNQQINAVIPNINNLYMYYFSNTDIFINQLLEKASAITISIVNKSKMESCYIPIPPKETQQKIVDIIESLFAKLDIAQEKVEHVLAESENRRSAILHNAFSGKLTEKWREENKNIVIEDIDLSLIDKNYDVQELEYDLPSTWKWVTFNEICTFIGSGVTPKGGQEVYTLNGIPFIRSQNVLRLKLDLSDVAYISDEINSKMKRTQIKGGETLFNITGASIGRACYVHRKQNTGNVNQHVCILRYKNFILENLPQYWLNSSMMQYFISDNQIGQTRQALNFKQIRGIMFPLCPYEEQKEIVRLLDKFLSVEDKVKSTCQSTLEAIATMRKSILAKAFRGELVS